MSRWITKSILIISTIVLLLHWRTTTVQAQVIFSDDFSGDLSNWQVVQADPGFWTVSNGQLVSKISNHYTQAMMVPKTELWPDDVTSYKVEFDMLPVRGADKNILFAYETPDDWYDLHFNRQGSELLKVTDGSMVWKEKSSNTLRPNGIWYHFELILANGHITIIQDGNTLFSLADPAYEGSYYKPGFRVTTGASAPTEVHFDNFVVTEVEDNTISLPVPLLKQTDPAWGDTEYDTATEWSNNPGITSWGCALTSAAMILQFHGFATLPDGIPLNPGSLNNWLNNQPDGYIGNGLLNWLAVTRLSYILAQTNNQYALEYRKHPPDKAAIQQQLEKNQPPILQIPGHFVVGNGVAANKDLTIADPAYSYTQLSQHEQDNRQLLSFRSFTPSYTDLSHVLIVHSPETNLALTHQGQPTNSFTTEEYLANFNNPAATTNKALLTELAQPGQDKYTLSVFSAEPSPTELTLYIYDQTGSVTTETISVTTSSYPVEYSLELNQDADAPPVINRSYSFNKLQTDLEQMVLRGDLSYWWVYFEFQKIIGYTTTASQANQQRYLTLIKNMLTSYENFFTPEARLYLEENLAIIEAEVA